jgi:hypothetical protein
VDEKGRDAQSTILEAVAGETQGCVVALACVNYCFSNNSYTLTRM